MPTQTIPLVGVPTQRGPIITSSSAPTKDARLVRCISTVIPNDATKTVNVYCEKTPGWALNSTPAGSDNGTAIYSLPSGNGLFSAFGTTTNTLYYKGSNPLATLGVISTAGSFVANIYDAYIAGDNYIFFTDSSGNGWFASSLTYADIASSFTGDTHTNTTIDNIAGVNMNALQIGQAISGTGIQAGTRIATVNVGGASITTTLATTATNAGITIAWERVAKIIDSVFTGYQTYGDFVELGGRLFIAATASGASYIIGSDLNEPWDWTADQIIPPNYNSDYPVGIAKYAGQIALFSSNAIQFFYNAGNASGSVLSQSANLSMVGFGAAVPSSGGAPLIRTMAGNVYFVGATNGVITGVYRFNGFTPEKISNEAVTRYVTRLPLDTNRYAFDTFPAFGQTYLYIGGNTDFGYLYCVETGKWTEAGFTGPMRITSSIGDRYAVRISGTTGKTYIMADNSVTYQDDSSAYTMTIQTEPFVLNGGNRFTINAIRLIADNQASGTTTLETSGDDYESFRTIGTFDMTKTRKEIRRGGYYKNSCAFRLTHSANTAWRGQALQVDWTPAAA